MIWRKEFTYLPQYEFTSVNQYGDRYKKIAHKPLSVAVLETDCNNAGDMRTLILLSNFLDAPVRYNFDADPQIAYIKVVNQEML